MEKKLNELLEIENKLKIQLDQTEDENYRKYRKMELEKKELINELEKAKAVERKMRKEIDRGWMVFFKNIMEFLKICKFFLALIKQLI